LGLLSQVLTPIVDSLVFMVDIDGSYATAEEKDEVLAICARLRELVPGIRLSLSYLQSHASIQDDLAELSDVFVYQAGHHVDFGRFTIDRSAHYASLPQVRPIIGIEAGYEYHRMVGGAGRFGPREVRRAAWRSVIAGGSSGIGYAAHGVWGWARNRDGDSWMTEARSGTMLDWRDAIHLPGAYEVVFVRRVIEEMGCAGALFSSPRAVAPTAEGWDGGLCADTTDGSVSVLYLPYGGPVDLGGCQLGERMPKSLHAFDLEKQVHLGADLSGQMSKNLRLDLARSSGEAVVFLSY
jgi:hypothetical protein